MNDFERDIDALMMAVESGAQFEFMLFLLSLSSLLGFMGILTLYFRQNYRNTMAFKEARDLTLGLRGRLEKLEQEINELKTTVLRSKEINSDTLDDIKKTLDVIKKKLKSEGELLDQVEWDELESNISSVKAELASATPAEPKTQEVVTEEPVAPVQDETPQPLEERLSKTRTGILEKFKNVFSGKPSIAPEDLDEIEELLVSADLGVKTSVELIEQSRAQLDSGKELSQSILLGNIKSRVKEILENEGQEEFPIIPQNYDNKPIVILLIGVNGVGKTTTAAKLASQWKDDGLKVTLAAADTFRAAAVDQLCEWGKRLDVPVITGAENAKPATVVFDALGAAEENGSDILLIDTAGRLHNKSNLMQELEGIRNVITKKLDRTADETLLVVDGATGQNALMQAKEFNDITPLSGLIVTKLDGTPKGGIVIAVKSELGIPVRYIGVGEAATDLRVFNSTEFTNAIFNG